MIATTRELWPVVIFGITEWSQLDGAMIASIAVGFMLLVLYLPAAIKQYGGKSNQALRHVAIWLGIAVVSIGGYAFHPELALVKDRIAGVLLPGKAIDNGGGTVVISKNSDEAHFSIDGYVNNQSTRFMLDTGASEVVFTHDAAMRLGLLVGEVNFTQTVSTANGLTKVAPIRIGELRIASLVLQDVKASVARQGELDVNLLGMSFLSRLSSYAVEADRLTLRQ